MSTAVDTAARLQPSADALERAKSGDEGVFRDLVEAISPEVTRWLLRGLCRDEDSASAVLQDAWMTSWVRLSTFDSTTNLRRWICRVAGNSAITVLRRGRRERSFVAAVADGAVLPAVRDIAWEPDDRDESDGGPVRAAIERLPERYRALAVLVFVHGRHQADAAELLGLSRPGFRMRLHRTRALLRERLRAVGLSRAPANRGESNRR